MPRRPLDDPATWVRETAAARERLERRLHGAAPAPYRALDLVAAARDRDRDAAFAAEDEALADLIGTDELRAGLYAMRPDHPPCPHHRPAPRTRPRRARPAGRDRRGRV